MTRQNPALRTALETAHLGAMGLWCGMTIAIGAVAATIFPAMRRLDPSLPDYADFPDAHWSIGAGSIMNPLFHMLDWASLALAGIALLTLILGAAFGMIRLATASGTLRTLALLCAVIALGYSVFSLRPAMDADLSAYHSAARAGDHATALIHKDAFDHAHPRASLLIIMTLCFAGLAFIAGAINAIHNPQPATPAS